MTICPRCDKEKPDEEINLKKLACNTCVKKEYNKLYRIRRKEEAKKEAEENAKKSEYFKKWYQEKGKYRRRKKNISNRDKRLYDMYLNRKSRHWSVEAIAKMFQISTGQTYSIIRKEKNKQSK